MTYTTKTLSQTDVEKAEKTGTNENIHDAGGSDGNIREMLSIYDSLSKLYETLKKLDNAIKKEISK